MSQQNTKNPIDILKYVIFRISYEGDVITNLKMQKILYYIYVWCLIKLGYSCFSEKFEAWPNGPVLPSVYGKLKKYGASPLNLDDFLTSKKDLNDVKDNIGSDLLTLIDLVLEQYASKTAFDLVNLTHNEISWKNARTGLSDFESSNIKLKDEDIIKQYEQAK